MDKAAKGITPEGITEEIVVPIILRPLCTSPNPKPLRPEQSHLQVL
jgi:hypothetical protein